MHIYICSHNYIKFYWAVSEELRWQEKQDWRIDWLADWQTGQKHYTLRNSLRGV